MNSIAELVSRFAKGEMVVVFDDEDRENEADIVLAIEGATPEKVSFVVNHAKGLLCASLREDVARARGLPLMPSNKSDMHATAFTLSVDSRSCRTGISPTERCQTAKDLLNPAFTLADFVTPGHLFPLIARPGGLLERRGHTEAAVSLCDWANVAPGALICEMIRDDGRMYSRSEAEAFACQHGLGFCTIDELTRYQRLLVSNVRKVSEARLPTRHGLFNIAVYEELFTGKEHLFMSMGEHTRGPVRIHSECLTGDVFASRKCDCGAQLDMALGRIAREGAGAIVYLRQEGRDIGLGEKIKAYALQQHEGLDTVDANLRLGHLADARDFHQAAWILRDQGFAEVRLLTNNPEKIAALEEHGLRVVPAGIEIAPLPENLNYLNTKKQKMGHRLSLKGVSHEQNH
jgi:3,4-dihydroxy 2-butanone 4-phosphate synthase/GTP cyclohydrolase II